MKNKKTELRKLKKALYICTVALITNLGLSSCGTKDANNINNEQKGEISLEETEIDLEEIETSEEFSVEKIENFDDLKTNCILFQEVPEDIES